MPMTGIDSIDIWRKRKIKSDFLKERKYCCCNASKWLQMHQKWVVWAIWLATGIDSCNFPDSHCCMNYPAASNKLSRYHCAKVSEHQGILVSKSVGNKCQGNEASKYSEIDVLPDCQVLPDSNCMNYSALAIELSCSSLCYTAALTQHIMLQYPSAASLLSVQHHSRSLF